MSQPEPAGLNLHGAVDLSALTAPPPTPADAPAGLVVDVTAATFGEVVQQSMQVPVVVDLYSTRSPASTELGDALVQLATSYAGKFVLARVAAESNPQIVQAFGAQSLPTVVALLKGQPVPLFQGVYPAEQIRAVLDELLRVAAENGVTGTVDVPEAPEQPEEPAEPPLPPHLQAAYDAIEADDLPGAVAAFSTALDNNPADAEAKAGLAQVNLMSRLQEIQAAHPSLPEVLTAAEQAGPADVEAQLAAADVEMASGRSAAGLDRLIATIKATAGPDREQVRLRLLDLFLVVGEGSADVAKARRDLAAALF